MNVNDLYDWKRHPVTQAIFSTMEERIATMTEYLITNSGDDRDREAQFKGAILAYRDILNTEFADIEEPQQQ